MSYNPASGTTTVRLENPHFANGVALGPKEDYVLVTETPGARITRLWLKGNKAGTMDVFIAGYPDNISYNDNGFRFQENQR